MQQMQEFYDDLFTDEQQQDDYLSSLRALTMASPEQMSVLDNGRTWNDWAQSNV